MPKYDIKCEECSYITEVEHKITEEHPPCDSCGGVMRTYFPVGTVLAPAKLVGSGWTRKIKKDKPVEYKVRGRDI